MIKRIGCCCMAVLIAAASMARADGVFVSGGLSAMREFSALPAQTLLVAVPTKAVNGATTYTLTEYSFPRFYRFDINEVRNPYGSIAIGYDWHWTGWRIDLQIQHESSVTANDHGRDSIGLQVRWYPFGQY
jgi:hypothetical protein